MAINGLGTKWSIGLNGDGHLLSTLDQESPFEYRAFTQQAVSLRLPRIDTSPEPGEAGLGDLWARSQHNWSEGEGQGILDGEGSSRLAAEYIAGFDPFTSVGGLRAGPGGYDNTFAGQRKMLFAHGNLVYSLGAGSSTFKRWDKNRTEESFTSTYVPVSANGVRPSNNIVFKATELYWATSAGIYKCSLPAFGGGWTGTDSKANNLVDVSVLAFGKGRLLACVANKVHLIDDLTSLSSGATPHYSHIDTSWAWYDAEESGQGFYLCGGSDAESKLYLMSFDASDASAGLTIGIPREVWRAPDSEKILTIEPYAGSAFLLGTSKGVRNCIVVDQEGNVIVGPLIESDFTVCSIAIFERYAFFPSIKYPTTPSRVGIAKMDLGTFAVSTINTEFLYWDDGTPNATRDGYAICTNPWQTEWSSPSYIFSSTVGVNGLLADEAGRSTLATFFQTGTTRFGSTVPKEARSLEVTIDPDSYAFSGRAGYNVQLATPPASAALNYGAVWQFKLSLSDWTPATDSTLFIQGNSESDYHWKIILTTTGKIQVKYLDTTDTVQTRETTVALPFSTWDKWTPIWITVELYTDHMDVWVKPAGTNPLRPTQYEMNHVGTQVVFSSVNFKGQTTPSYNSMPIYAFYDTADWTVYESWLWEFTGWSNITFLYTTAETMAYSFKAAQFAPDALGNTWAPTSVSPYNFLTSWLKVYYAIDGKEWELLGGWYSNEDNPVLSRTLTFPENTQFKDINLRFVGTQFLVPWPVSIKDWRMTAEPVPTPRYFRYYVPIQLYDTMTLLDGSKVSRNGLAWEKLKAIETIFKAGTIVDLQKPSGYLEPLVTTRVRIEEMEFKEFAPPKGCSGFGGILLLVLKEVAT